MGVFTLLAESLKYILSAEYEAKQLTQLVLDKSKESIAQAKADGEKLVAATKARAETEMSQLKKTSDSKAMESAAELASSTANKLATMRARAERRLDTVAQRIFERIVSI